MRWGLIILGLVVLLIGGVWFFQGIGMLLGSPMTSQPFWAIAGGVLVIVGLAVTVVGFRGKRKPVGTNN